MGQKRYRMRFDFQLNVANPDEYAIAETIAWLKAGKLYSKTIRDGIRLITDLRAGSLAVLFELFPWVQAEFLEYMASIQPPKSDTEVELQQQLLRIEALLSPSGNSTPTSGRGGGKSMTPEPVANTMSEDNDDDLDLLTVKKSSTTGDVAQNFLNSLKQLQG